MARSSACGFQFYDSPIKRRKDLRREIREMGFNSMIVRLKEEVEASYQNTKDVSIL